MKTYLLLTLLSTVLIGYASKCEDDEVEINVVKVEVVQDSISQIRTLRTPVDTPPNRPWRYVSPDTLSGCRLRVYEAAERFFPLIAPNYWNYNMFGSEMSAASTMQSRDELREIRLQFSAIREEIGAGKCADVDTTFFLNLLGYPTSIMMNYDYAGPIYPESGSEPTYVTRGGNPKRIRYQYFISLPWRHGPCPNITPTSIGNELPLFTIEDFQYCSSLRVDFDTTGQLGSIVFWPSF